MKMKKIMMIAIIMMIGFVLMPNVHAEGGWYSKDITASNGSDSFKNGALPTITGQETSEVVLNYDSIELQYVPKEPSVGKLIDCAWLGIKVVAPDEVSDSIIANNVKYYPDEDSANPRNFYEKKDSEGDSKPYYILLYSGVTKEDLEKAAKDGLEEYTAGTWYFDWNNDGEYEQKIVIKVNPKKVTLLDLESNGGGELFNPTMAEEIFGINKKVESNVEPTQNEEVEQKEDSNNPDTSDISLGLLLTLITTSTLGFAYVYKKRYN